MDDLRLVDNARVMTRPTRAPVASPALCERLARPHDFAAQREQRDRDQLEVRQDQHDQRGERLADGHHEAAEHEPDQSQKKPHTWSRLARSG